VSDIRLLKSIHSKQEQPHSKLDWSVERPLEETTEKDVGQLQLAMTKGRGGIPIEADNIVSDFYTGLHR